jgi:hypothetical protein
MLLAAPETAVDASVDDEGGDRDGDGFQEYQTRSPVGYENMGWKDSAIPSSTGRLIGGKA